MVLSSTLIRSDNRGSIVWVREYERKCKPDWEYNDVNEWVWTWMWVSLTKDPSKGMSVSIAVSVNFEGMSLYASSISRNNW